MKRQEYSYMSKCLKHGIRVYPILKYGGYYLIIEFNRTPEFFPNEIIDTVPGEVKYDKNKNEWSDKMLELYEHLYRTKVAPKTKAA